MKEKKAKNFFIEKINTDDNFNHFTKQYSCKLCQSVEFELDLGEHLFEKHNIYSKEYVLNLSNVFNDTIDKLKFGKYSLIKNLYTCLVCNTSHITKTIKHIKKHPLNVNFVEMHVVKYQCNLCENYLLDDIIENHMIIKHNFPKEIKIK